MCSSYMMDLILSFVFMYVTGMFISALLLILCCGVGVVIYLLVSNKKQTTDPTLLEWVKSTQRDLQNLQRVLSDSSARSTRELTDSMRTQTQDIHDRLTKAAEVIGELKKEAGAFSEVSRSMKELHEFLKSPKLRGNIGEEVLTDLISQMFPKQKFFIQHRFRNGSIVDAAIQTDAGILPIDSKFPMEDFQVMMQGETESVRADARKAFIRDVKKHIEDIARKYILPQEGTMDFALMYVPSESVYYEIINEVSLLDYARSNRVYIVSPTSLYAHLQTILLSYEGKKIETKTKELFALFRSLQHDYQKVDTQFQTLGRHLTNAQNTFTTVATGFTAMGRSLNSSQTLVDEKEELLITKERDSI
ncbi:hypothetical protein C5B42_00125 [Candidatus Cerribacteria bacterium 'Amazon FNV 2010 28 9']|uniref:DNA recombination protein RmuC n=1 Tax=Candidatus Cerribacteria bacterium 'Amazon FNV 2010 28 9' TaxID=2081795 RepID=A0A317JSY4_9BACT|nr:MAG: hypothetical protein C5B42_00125 [Candidatus Cerribacteria bacterium 'Amazon FNV 2010 28 9']